MKKKLVAIVLTVMMVASLTTACGGDSKQASTPAPAPETKTETKADTPAPAPETKAEDETPAPAPEADANVDAGSESEGFTLLDVTTDMIQTGVYATGDDGVELIFSMFTDPSGTPFASLFGFNADGTGNVICGTYAAASETDEDGITWTVLTVSDVYSGSDFTFGFGELDDQVYILDSEVAYEGQYLTADETIVYMGTAAALLQ